MNRTVVPRRLIIRRAGESNEKSTATCKQGSLCKYTESKSEVNLSRGHDVIHTSLFSFPIINMPSLRGDEAQAAMT